MSGTEPEPRPLPGHAALWLPAVRGAPAEIGIADLHLGLGDLGPEGRGLGRSGARAMAEELLELCGRHRARGVLVVGDVKHPIVGASRPVAEIVFDFFSTLLSQGLAARVILGNHDVGLARLLPREVSVVPVGGLRRGDLGLFHGHAWPSASVLAARRLAVGHLHPGIRLAPGPDPLSGKQRCWVRCGLEGIDRAPRGRPKIRAEELLVLPAFNPLAGVESLNQEAPGRGRSFLFGRFLLNGRPRAYLIDGTDLGPLPRPTGSVEPPIPPSRTVGSFRRRPRERPRSPSGR